MRNIIFDYVLLFRGLLYGEWLLIVILNPAYKTVNVVECQVDKGLLGKSFKKDAKQVTEHLTGLSTEEVDALDKLLQENG